MSHSALKAAHRDPDFDSDCTIHGVATWSTEHGHVVIHDCDDRCPGDCPSGGEETGAWCDGPLQMRTDAGTPPYRLKATDPTITAT